MTIIRLQGETEKKKGIYFELDYDAEPIGEGGTGKVYAGRCVNTATHETRPVAIKFMFAGLSEQIVERARREASIQLRNDNLVEMLGFVETETTEGNTRKKHYHVVSELLNGVSLTDILDGKCTGRDGKEIAYARKLLNMYSNDPEHFAKTIIRNVLSGLMALHDAGYIHRDIDPSNIMITDTGHIKLIDFGICKQMDKLTTHDKVQTVAGVFMGKPEYASPELALGDLKHQNQTSDIYAVGVLMFQCITGHVPFEGTRFEILDKQVKQKLPLKKIKNSRLRRIISKSCEKKQELRYQTSAEMRVDIESLDIKRALDPRKKRLLLIALAVVAALLLATGIGLSRYRNHKEAETQRIREQHTRDSLTAIVTHTTRRAKELSIKGYKHEEEYDRLLVDAKRLYNRADSAAKQIDNYKPTYANDRQQLIKALQAAREELWQKTEILKADNDPVVAEETKRIEQRIKDIDNVLK